MAYGARNLHYDRGDVLIPGKEKVNSPDAAFDDLPDYAQPYIGDALAYGSRQGRYDPTLGSDTTKVQDGMTGRQYAPVTGTVVKADIIELPSMGKEQTEQPAPIDPLTGLPEGYYPRAANGQDLFNATSAMVHLLQSVVVAIKGQNPQMPAQVNIDGLNSDLSSNNPKKIFFQIGDKNVPALQLYIQNNTGSTIYVDLSQPASAGAIAITTGQSLNIRAMANFISIVASAVGPFTINGSAAGGVVVRAWSNPEWTNMRGNA